MIKFWDDIEVDVSQQSDQTLIDNHDSDFSFKRISRSISESDIDTDIFPIFIRTLVWRKSQDTLFISNICDDFTIPDGISTIFGISFLSWMKCHDTDISIWPHRIIDSIFSSKRISGKIRIFSIDHSSFFFGDEKI